MRLMMHKDLQALAELIGELGFSWEKAPGVVGNVVNVQVGDIEVTVVRSRERFLANDRIPGIPMTHFGSRFFCYEVTI